jgi:uncharacterized protein (TIGR02145 family)
MKKKLVISLTLLVAVAAQLSAQGIVVYKTDGTKVYFPAEQVEKVGTYDYGENPGEEPGEEPGEDPGDNPANPGNAPSGAMGVDLGLPSGTLWANMNIGATSPQEDGLYFAWGETKGYTSNTSDGRKFDWASYKWMTTDSTTWRGINKYQAADGETTGCWYQYDWDIEDYKFVGDGKTVLDVADDAAAANWGGDWRMPTIEEIEELLANTTNEWITVGTVKGRKFTSKVKNADGTYNSIFLPAAGRRFVASLVGQGTDGYYWSASLYTSYTHDARHLNFRSGSASTNGSYRYYGRSVRAVLRKK